jgi:hypothetical protein
MARFARDIFRNRPSCVFPAYVGSRESIVYRTKDIGSIAQTSMAPVTLIKARDIEINEIIMAG